MSLWNVVVVVGIVSFISLARAVPAFVAAPPALVDQDEEVLDREARAAGSGGGQYSGSGSGNYDYGLGDDEDYPLVVRPTHIRVPEIQHFHVDASITARFANTLVNSILVNTEEYAQEAEFSIILPDQAFISRFVMIIENIPYEAEVKEKEQAQKEYNAAKKRGDTAGQVKQHATKPNTFSVAVNVAAYSAVTFNLTYQELLRRRHGIIEYKINIDPGQVIASLKVDIRIAEPQGLQELDVMWTSTGAGSSSINEAVSSLQDDVFLERISQSRAHIKFHPSKDHQKLERVAGIAGNLVVHYDVLHDLSAGNLQVMNGYFVHYFSPEGLSAAHKNVVFVIDVSGSMSGTKIKQTREAMKTILADIREGDRLNIVTFTDDIRVWRPNKMVDCTRSNIDDALEYVDTLGALYGTNLHGGVMAGVDLLEISELADIQDERDAFSMIIMLTDGLPSSGVTNLMQIRNQVAGRINGKFALFCLGFGNDVDQKFLEQLASENQGVGRKIYADSSAVLQLKGFYDEVATPLLFNINIDYNHINVGATTQTKFLSYFEGTEIVVAGQLPNELTVQGNGVSELVATVSANSMDSFIELQTSVNTQTPSAAVLSRHAVDDFCQRLWAYLTIKSLLQKRTIARTSNERADLKAKALELSLKYHFVTPLTSLLVVRPEDEEGEDEVVQPLGVNDDEETQDANDALDTPEDDIQVSNNYGGVRPVAATSPVRGHGRGSGGSRRGGGGGGGGGGGFADSDPHFVVHVPASDVSVCFDITGQPGDVYNLLSDQELGVQVLGFIVAAPEQVPGTARIRTYFGRIGVHLPGGVTVRMTTDAVSVNNNMVLSWSNTVAVYKGNWSVEVVGKQVVISRNDGGVTLVFMLHRMNPDNLYKIDHLGFYIREHKGLSQSVHGLMGQFQRRKVAMVPFTPSDGGALFGELHVMDRTVKVVQRSRLNSLVGVKQSCWFAANNANDLIDGKHTDYLVPLEALP